MDLTQVAALALAVAGMVELVKRLFAKDWVAAVTIVVAAVAGALFGPQVGFSWFNGMLAGFSASGLITTASYVGK